MWSSPAARWSAIPFPAPAYTPGDSARRGACLAPAGRARFQAYRFARHTAESARARHLPLTPIRKRMMTESMQLDIQGILGTAAPLSFLLIDRCRNWHSGKEHPCAEERRLQRAVLPRSFPGPAGDAGCIITEALAQTAGILTFLSANFIPDKETNFYFVYDIDKSALPQAGGAERPAGAHRPGGALSERHLALLHRGPDRRQRSGARGNHGGAGDREVIDAHAIVSPQAELAADVPCRVPSA